MPPSPSWKKFERRVASFFGTRRTPLSGRNSGHNTSSDTLDLEIYLEAKLRANHATYNLWKATKILADKEKKLPVLALQQKYKMGCLIVIHQDDFEKLIAIMIQRRQG